MCLFFISKGYHYFIDIAMALLIGNDTIIGRG